MFSLSLFYSYFKLVYVQFNQRAFLPLDLHLQTSCLITLSGCKVFPIADACSMWREL